MDIQPNNLILIRGLPGSGKSTMARDLRDYYDRPREVYIFEADDFFTMADGSYLFERKKLSNAHSVCQERTRLALKYTNNPVIVTNTFTTRKELKPYLDMGNRYGRDILELVCNGNFESLHDVPANVIDMMRTRWED